MSHLVGHTGTEMPGSRKHRSTGRTAGAIAALISARDEAALQMAAETIGGWWFGGAGGVFPDSLEPATSSHHRNMFHGAALNALGARYAVGNCRAIQEVLRLEAASHFAAAESSLDFIGWVLHTTAGLFLHFLAGGVVGFPVGILSHLCLDYGSPRGIPLLVRGF